MGWGRGTLQLSYTGTADSRTHAEYRAAIVAAKKASVAAARKHELLEPVEDVPRAETSTVVG